MDMNLWRAAQTGKSKTELDWQNRNITPLQEDGPSYVVGPGQVDLSKSKGENLYGSYRLPKDASKETAVAMGRAGAAELKAEWNKHDADEKSAANKEAPLRRIFEPVVKGMELGDKISRATGIEKGMDKIAKAAGLPDETEDPYPGLGDNVPASKIKTNPFEIPQHKLFNTPGEATSNSQSANPTNSVTPTDEEPGSDKFKSKPMQEDGEPKNSSKPSAAVLNTINNIVNKKQPANNNPEYQKNV